MNLNADGLLLAGDLYSLTNSPIAIGSKFICSLRKDKPELVIVFGPGMTIIRIDAASPLSKQPIDCYTVLGAELSDYYDGFVSLGNIYFLPASSQGKGTTFPSTYASSHIPIESSRKINC